MNAKKLKVARVATVPFFLDYQLRHQIQDLISNGFTVSAISSSGADWERLKNIEHLKCVPIDIARKPSPLKDLVSVYRLYKHFCSERYDIVHSTTPKAGLLCAIAAKLAGTQIRMHTFTGQIWTTKTGVARWILRFLDKCIVGLNTQCYADSESQRNFLVKQNVGTKESIKVLGLGSLAGVSIKRFNYQKWDYLKDKIQRELNFSNNDFVMTFLGRISREKGIIELIDAFIYLKEKYSNLKLLIIGPCEANVLEAQLNLWQEINGVSYIGATDVPEKYLSVSQLLCLPSYREGFGTVILEAAAMKVPTVGTNITGLIDAVKNGKTGTLVNPKDSMGLAEAIEELIIHDDKREEMGEFAYTRCIKNYDEAMVSKLVANEYKKYYG